MLAMGIGVGGVGGGVTFPLTSTSANPAQSGAIRLAFLDLLNWRNGTNTADIGFQESNASGQIPQNTLNYTGAGLTAPFFSTFNGTTAAAGVLRLQTGDTINWRNNANLGDISISKTTGDIISTPNIGASGGNAALTGTGACTTFSGQVGGKWAGSAACASATAASTLTITPGVTAPNGWACSVQDETTRSNLFQQTSHNTTTCTLTATSVTQNDVFVFTAIAF